MIREEEFRQAVIDIWNNHVALDMMTIEEVFAFSNDIANWCYSHPQRGLVDIEKAVKWLSDRIQINQNIESDENGSPYAKSYLDYMEKKLKAVEEITNEFRKAMMEE